MAELTDIQPTNLNFLQDVHFRFMLNRTPAVQWFCTEAAVPAISLASIQVSTPFSQLVQPGHKMDWGDLNITFIVDEDFKNYLEIYNWITALGFPEDFSGYPSIKNAHWSKDLGQWSDGTLIILSSKQQPILNVLFTNLTPYALSDLTFDSSREDIKYFKCTASFKYHRYTIETI